MANIPGSNHRHHLSVTMNHSNNCHCGMRKYQCTYPLGDIHYYHCKNINIVANKCNCNLEALIFGENEQLC